eukprot:XP_001704044.1 Hypothetical protein GL50803_26497 [Giardia lamblia ATCC 50803]
MAPVKRPEPLFLVLENTHVCPSGEGLFDDEQVRHLWSRLVF